MQIVTNLHISKHHMNQIKFQFCVINQSLKMQRSTTGHGSQEAGKRADSLPSIAGERESMGTADSRAQMAQGTGADKAKRRAEYSKPWKQQPAPAKTLVSVSGCQTSDQDMGAGGGAATKFLQATPDSPQEIAGGEAGKHEGSSPVSSHSLQAKAQRSPEALGRTRDVDKIQKITGAPAGVAGAGPEAFAPEASPRVPVFDPKVTKRASLGSAGPKGQSTHSEGDEYLAAGARTGLLNFRAPSQGEDSPAARALLATGGDDAVLTYPTEGSAANAKREPLQIRKNEVHRLSTISQHSPGTLQNDSMYRSGFTGREPAGPARESPRGAPLLRKIPGDSAEAKQGRSTHLDGGSGGQTRPPPNWVARSLEWAQHHCPHCEHGRSPGLVTVRDMGSLKLTEVLRFQQDGRCCRSFCPICRHTHTCEFARQVRHIDYSRGADAGELLKTTPRPYDLEIQRLTRSSRPKKVKQSWEPVQMQNQSPSALARHVGRRSQTLSQDLRAEASGGPRLGQGDEKSGVVLCIDGVVASRVLKQQPATAAVDVPARRVRRTFDTKAKSIFPGSGMSFSLDRRIDSRIVIENAHESASLDSGADPQGTFPRVEDKPGAQVKREDLAGNDRPEDQEAYSRPQSLEQLESTTPKGPSDKPAQGQRARQPGSLKIGTGDCHLPLFRVGPSPGRTDGRRSSQDTGSPQKSSTWHQISPRLASSRRAPGDSGPSGPATIPHSPPGLGVAPARMSLKAAQQMESQRRKQGTPGGVSISVKVPKEARQGGTGDGGGVDSNGQRLKNVSQINLALEQTLESQNAEGGVLPGAKPVGSSAMTYVVVDMAEGERTSAENRGQNGADERPGAARALLALGPDVHVVNTSMIASHLHKQTMPFNHFRHPSMAKAVAGQHGAKKPSPKGSRPVQNSYEETKEPRHVGPVRPGHPTPGHSAEPDTAYWPGRGFARSRDKTPPEILSAAQATSLASKAAPTFKTDTLNKDLLPFSAATDDGTGELPCGEIRGSRDPLRALNSARGTGAEAISERFQNRSIQRKIAKTMESPGALRNSVEQSRNRWPEGQQNLSSSAVPSCESKVVLLTRGGRDSQLIREATRGAGFRLNAPKPLSIPGPIREPHAGGVTSRSTAERDVKLTSTIEELQTKLRGSNALEGVPLRGSDGAPTPSLGAPASPIKLRSTFFFGSRADERGSSQFPYQYVEAQPTGGPQGETRFADSAENGEDAPQTDNKHLPNPERLRLNLDGLQDRRTVGRDTLGSSGGAPISGASGRPQGADGFDKAPQQAPREVLITGQSLGAPAPRGSMQAAISGQRHPKRSTHSGDRGTIKRPNEGGEQAAFCITGEGNAGLYGNINSKRSKNSPVRATQASQFESPSRHEAHLPASSRHSPLRGRPPPFRVQLDRKKKGGPYRGEPIPERSRYHLEARGASREFNQDYIKLQQKITENLCQPPHKYPGKHQTNVAMINMAQQAFHEIDILIQEGAPRSPAGSKDCTKSPATFAPNRAEAGRPLKASPAQSNTSVNSMTHRDRFNDIEDEDPLQGSPKQGFLNLPKYGPPTTQHHNPPALTGFPSPTRGPSRLGPYTPQDVQEVRLQSDLDLYPEFGHGLEIQGTEVQMLDPHLAKQSLQKRNQIIRKIDRDQLKTPVRSNPESIATPQNGKITVTMDPKARDFQVMEERVPPQQLNLGARRYDGPPLEPAANQDLHSGSAAINTSIFGRNTPIQNNTLNLNIKTDAQHQLDVTLHQTQRAEDPDNTIDLPLSHKDERKLRQSQAHIKNQHEVEHNSSVAAGTSSSISQKHAPGPRGPSSQFMIEDIKLFRDFVLYYNKSRFKKLRAPKHAKNDQIILNQDQLCHNEEMRSLYYQLRDQKRLDAHLTSVKSKIGQKMEEIRRAHKKHRNQLIKRGDLMDDEGDLELERIIAEFSKEGKKQDKQAKLQKDQTSAIQKKDRFKREQKSKQQQEDTKQHQINEEKIFQDTMNQLSRKAPHTGPTADQRREHGLETTMPTVTIDSRISREVPGEPDDLCVYEANTVRPMAYQDISKFVVQGTTRTQNQQAHSVHLQRIVEHSPIKNDQDSIISKDAGSIATTRRGMGLGTTSRGKNNGTWNLASSMVDRDSLKMREAMKFNTRKSVKMSEIREAMYNNHYLSDIKQKYSVRHPDCSKIGYATTRGRVDWESTAQTQQDSRLEGAARASNSIQESGEDNASINKTTSATVDQASYPDGTQEHQTQNHAAAGRRDLSATPLTTEVRSKLRQIGGLRASLAIQNSSLFSPGGTQRAWKDQADQRRVMLKTTLHTGRCREKMDTMRAEFNNTQKKFHIKPLYPLDRHEGQIESHQNKDTKPVYPPTALASEYIIMKDQQTELNETLSLYEQEQKRLFGGSPKRKSKKNIESAEYIDFLSSKGAVLPKIAKIHAKQMAEEKASRLWQRGKGKIEDTQMFHIDLYHQRAQRKAQTIGKNSVFDSCLSVNKTDLKMNQQTIDYIGTLLPSTKDKSGFETIVTGGGVPHLRLLENRFNAEIYSGDGLNYRTNASPQVGLSATFDHETQTGEKPLILTDPNLQKVSRKINHSVDFSNVQAPHGKRQSLQVGKRLKAKQHMMPFEEIKPTEFTKAKLKMRNPQEERDRLLGPQFTKEYIKAKNAREAAFDREQLQALDNFLKDGLTAMDKQGKL